MRTGDAMSIFAPAVRNLLRNRRRSMATILAMVIGSVSILLFGGYVQNIICGLQTDYVRGGGHLALQHRDYFLYGSGDPTAYGIAGYAHVIDVIRHDPVLAPLLTVATPTLDFGGIAGNFAAGASRTIFASGVVVADQNAMQRWNDYGFPDAPAVLSLTGTAADAAVIGTGVARVLRLCGPLRVANCPEPSAVPTGSASHARSDVQGEALPEDIGRLATRDAPSDDGPLGGIRIELLAATTTGAPNVARLRVMKAVDLGVKEADDNFVGLHLRAAQRLLYGGALPQVTSISLQLHHTDQIPQAQQRLDALLATTLHDVPLAVYDFRALNPYYGQTVGMFTAIFGFIAVLIGAIVLFTVGNTMNAAIVERTVEVGTLRAMGLRRAGIRRLFVSEALLLGAVGAVAGMLIALLVAALVNHSGLTWTPPGRIDPIHLHVRVWGEWAMLSGTALALLSVAMLSAWWPARRAAHMPVVEALRHV